MSLEKGSVVRYVKSEGGYAITHVKDVSDLGVEDLASPEVREGLGEVVDWAGAGLILNVVAGKAEAVLAGLRESIAENNDIISLIELADIQVAIERKLDELEALLSKTADKECLHEELGKARMDVSMLQDLRAKIIGAITEINERSGGKFKTVVEAVADVRGEICRILKVENDLVESIAALNNSGSGVEMMLERLSPTSQKIVLEACKAKLAELQLEENSSERACLNLLVESGRELSSTEGDYESIRPAVKGNYPVTPARKVMMFGVEVAKALQMEQIDLLDRSLSDLRRTGEVKFTDLIIIAATREADAIVDEFDRVINRYKVFERSPIPKRSLWNRDFYKWQVGRLDLLGAINDLVNKFGNMDFLKGKSRDNSSHCDADFYEGTLPSLETMQRAWTCVAVILRVILKLEIDYSDPRPLDRKLQEFRYKAAVGFLETLLTPEEPDSPSRPPEEIRDGWD